jgi:hypothetical protein
MTKTPRKAASAAAPAGGKKGGRGKGPSESTVREVWARSGGICAFPGCTEVLYRDKNLLLPANIGEVAHNVGASADGPRGDAKRSHVLSDDPENLLLFCRNHHKLVDEDKGARYPEQVLTAWKKLHEANVQQAASLKSGHLALPIIVRGPIGGQQVTVNPGDTVRAMIENHTAPIESPFAIEVDGDGDRDDRLDRWIPHVIQARNRLNVVRSAGALKTSPLAIFPLAEMPLLMYVGNLIGDKTPMTIYQYRRHANSWAFEDPAADPVTFKFSVPEQIRGHLVLNLGITAPIARERILAALGGGEATVIDIIPSQTGTGVVKGPKTVENFRAAVRDCLDQIERVTPRSTPIHVFPAMPAPLAFAFGSCIMPKVSSPVVIYDARGAGAPFGKALQLPLE